MGQFGRIHKDALEDAALAEFYRRLLVSGRERASFYNIPRMSVPEFVNEVRDQANPWWLLTFENDMAGMYYLTERQGKSAVVHFTFLPLPAMRTEKGVPAAVALARFGLAKVLHDTYMDGTHIIDSLGGKTPEWNTAAVKVVRRSGATVLGSMPAACYCHDSGANTPGLITYYTRETVPAEWAEY